MIRLFAFLLLSVSIFAAEKTVYLTFDDGPQPGTTDVLDALKEEGAVATFFLTGSNAISVGGLDEQAAIVKRALAEGNAIGSHCYIHKPMTKSQYRAAYGDLASESQREAFRKNWARNEEHFRARLGLADFRFTTARLPGDGGTLKHLVAETNRLGMRHYYWDFEMGTNGAFKWLKARNWQGIEGVDTEDVNLPKDGAVILMHDRHWGGADKAKLTALLRLLKANGYGFGTLPEKGVAVPSKATP